MKNKLTSNDIAKIANVDMSTVTYWARKGLLKSTIINKPVNQGGDQYIFDREDVKKFLKYKNKQYKNEINKLQKKVNSIEDYFDTN
jgi:predicted transcriptional regulator